MDPRIAAIVSRYSDLLDATPHGEQRPLIKAACAELGKSDKTFYRYLREYRGIGRKRRSDSGEIALTLEEAMAISGYIMESFRQNGKRKTVSLETAVDILRANGVILAARVDTETGEVFPLSYSAIRRALRHYTLHPGQLRKPSPHIKLETNYPNELWQIDASVCVLYYLPDGGSAIVELDEAVHYKNKPENLKAIEQWRVIRYVLTDHTTNVTRWRYYPHAESGEHSVKFLAWAMAPKANPADPFQGRPANLYVDPGIRNSLVKRFCARLGIELREHKPRNARATGSVENGQWRTETEFEAGLKFQRSAIQSFDDLNRLAETHQLHYNASKIHSRHKLSRFDAWMFIKEHQLVKTRPYDVLLLLATEEPKKRDVSGNLTVEYKGKTWDVSDVPGVLVDHPVWVHWHPFQDCAMAVIEDLEGRETHIELADVSGVVDPANGQYGFSGNRAHYGEFKRLPDTVADKNRKQLSLMASGSDTHEADQKARRKKQFEPYGGQIDPFKAAKETPLPAYIKKRGTELNVAAPTMETLPLNYVQAAKLLKPRLEEKGIEWTPEHLQLIKRRYPDNRVPQEEMDRLLEQLINKPNLALVKREN